MSTKPISPQRARERALFRYRNALERGDFDTVADVLRLAERDPILVRMIDELHDAEESPSERVSSAPPARRAQRGITEVHINREPSPDGRPPEADNLEDKREMMTTWIHSEKYRVNLQFLTALAAALVMIIIGAVLIKMISQPVGDFQPLAVLQPTATEAQRLAGCQLLDNAADPQAESVRLADEANTTPPFSRRSSLDDPAPYDLMVLLGICALQTSYTLEADQALQHALERARNLPMVVPDSWREIINTRFSPDGKYILGLSGQLSFPPKLDTYSGLTGTPPLGVGLWAAQTLEKVRQFEDVVTVSPDTRYVVTADAGDDGPLRIWDTNTGSPVQTIEGPIPNLWGAVFSPDDRYVVTTGDPDDPTVRLWDTATGNLSHTFTGHTGGVWPLAFSPDSRYALSAPLPASGAGDSRVRLWSVATGELIQAFNLSPANITRWGLAFSPDSRHVLIGYGADSGMPSENAVLQEWSIETGEPVRQFATNPAFRAIWGIQISPDGRYLLATTMDGPALYDYQTGELIRIVFETSDLYDVDFSPDGHVVRVGTSFNSENGNRAYLFDVETGQRLRYFAINAGRGGGFSPDGRRMVSLLSPEFGAISSTFVVYDTDYRDFIRYACSKVSRDFTPEERAQYGLSEATPTCPRFGEGYTLPPGMTPVPTQSIPLWTPIPPLDDTGG